LKRSAITFARVSSACQKCDRVVVSSILAKCRLRLGIVRNLTDRFHVAFLNSFLGCAVYDKDGSHQMSKVTYTSPSQTYAFSASGWYVENDAWNVANLTDGVDYSASLTYDPNNLAGTYFSWTYPANVGGVYAFPHIDYESWAAGVSSTQTANMVNLSATYSVSLSNLADSTAAFDLWFNSQANGSWSTTSTEVLIQVHSTFGAYSNEPFTLSDSDFTGASVHASESSSGGANWNFIVVTLPSDMMSGTLNISNILKELVLDGLMTGQEYLTSLQFGSEVQGGSGSLQINSLGYNWTANATTVLAAGENTFTITTPGGNDIVGNGGVDTVVYSGSHSNYQIKSSGSETLVTYENNVSSLDELQGITNIQFSDGTYNTVTGTFTAATSANLTLAALPPAAPLVSSVSPETNVAGSLTNANHLTLSGTAGANTTVEVFDGKTELGTATVNSSGNWSFATGLLVDGTHSFTATDANAAGATSAASASVVVTVDTVAPAVTESLAKDTGSSATDKITSNDTLTGSGDPNAVVHFTVDGHLVAGTATANASGVWTFTPTNLSNGTHTIVASETDAAGNTGTASLTFTLDTTAPNPTITNEVLSNGKVTLTGTSLEAGDTISVYDGSKLLGTTTTGSNDSWSFVTGSASNAEHIYTVTATDVAGNIGHSSNEAILGSTAANAIVLPSGNDIIIGDGGGDRITAGSGSDTFIFKAIADSTPASPQTIVNFNHANDTIEFTDIAGINSTNGVPTFQGQLTGSGNLSLHAHSIGYIEVGGNTEVLVNTTNIAEIVSASNVHAANMEIILAGIHLDLASSNFHLV
jgi:Bacterial Ig-like domain